MHDILVQAGRDKRAALKPMRKLLKRQGVVPKAVVTDRLRSYGAAFGETGLQQRHEMGGRRNDRAEKSHQPVRRQERAWIGFKRPGTTLRFLSGHAAVYICVNVQRHPISRRTLREFRALAFDRWRDAVAAA